MITMKRLLVLATCLFLSILNLQAQPGWNWGDQIDVAKEKNAIYTDMVKVEKYSEAISPHGWLLENAPDLNESLYQNGAKIYEELAEKEKEASAQEKYQLKAMEMYDLRIKYFGNEASVLNRKVYPAYKFYKNDKAKYPELFQMFKQTFEITGEDFFENNFVAYMDVVRRYKTVGGPISDEEVLDIYTSLSEILDKKLLSGKNLDRVNNTVENIDKLLTLTIDLNCDYVESLLGPKLAETGDFKVASKIFKLMLQNKCTDRSLAFDAAKIVNENSPDFAISKFLGSRASRDGDREAAIDFYSQALGLTEESAKKAEIYLSLAKLDYQVGLKSSARTNCRKALSFDPSMSNAHVLIGNLYLSSFEECKQGEMKTLDYAVFIAAHNAFQKAGDREGMIKAEALFPSITDIFTEEFVEGETIDIGCWINESVILTKRTEN